MEQVRGHAKQRRHHDVVAGGVVALVGAAGVAAIVLAAIPATRFVPDGVRSPASTALVFVAIELAFAGTGALLVHRRAANPIGWLLLGVALVDGTNRLAEYWSATAVVARPGILPAGYGFAWLDSFTEGVVVLLLAAVVLLFPTGRPPSRGWWWALAVLGGGGALATFARTLRPGRLEGVAFVVTNPLGIERLGLAMDVTRVVALAIVTVGVAACAASLIPRWHAADAEGRLQLKWLASASLLLVLIVPLVPLLPDPFTVLYGAALAAFPITIGIAVCRVRLDAIDAILRRTAAAVLIAATLVALYLGVLVVTTAAVGRPGDPFLVLLAAVVTIVAFPPARRWADRVADRLVLGPRARPYEVLSEFTADVGGTVAGEELIDRMARVAAEGVGAARAEVWVSDGTVLQRAACWPVATSARPPVPAVPSPIPGSDRTYPVAHDGRLLGALAVSLSPGTRLRPAEERLLTDLAAGAALVLENARLIAELRASRERLVEAQDGERRRIERDLHDGAQQRLVALAIDVRRARQQLGNLEPCMVGEVLDRAGNGIQQALDELRELARGIHPAILTTGGLGAALQSLADRSAVPVIVRLQLPRRLPETVEATAYFVAAEALANATRHASADQVEISAALDHGQLRLEVRDDGRGGARPEPGGGLEGLSDRVAAVGGTLTVISPAGAGTTVVIGVPCGSS